jgi:hypothetical protein
MPQDCTGFSVKTEERSRLSREMRIDLISLIVLAGFVASVFTCYVRGTYLGLGYPFNTFLFQPADRFMDYFNGLSYATEGHGAGMVGTQGVAYLLFRVFYLISFKNAYVSFTLYTLAIVMYVLFYNLKNLFSGPPPKVSGVKLMRSLFILSFLSYPVLFTLDRGNMEGFAFISLSLFIYFFRSNRTGIGTLFLAAAAALKVYPIVFIILYLAEKRYKEAAIFGGVLLVLSAFAYDATQGIYFTFSRFISMVKSSGDPTNLYNTLFVIGDEGTAFSSSAYGALKAAIYLWDPLHSGPVILKLFRAYYTVSLLLFGLISLYVIIVEREFWRKIAILTLTMILFPFVTADYKLLNLYIPMWLFLNSEKGSQAHPLYTIFFGLLLIPKAYYTIKGDINISVILNPLIICIFLLYIIAVGLRSASTTGIRQNIAEHLTAVRNLLRFRRVRSAG